jgi:hypothetical protein
MNIPRWLAWSIVAAWCVHLRNLWPLPNESIAQMAATLVPSTESLPPGALDGLETSLWISWVLWLLIVPAGIAAGLMALYRRRAWLPTFVAASAAYLLLLCPWSLSVTIHGNSFQSFSRFIDHASWTLKQPSILFGTVFFPLFTVAILIYLVAAKLRVREHAI